VNPLARDTDISAMRLGDRPPRLITWLEPPQAQSSTLTTTAAPGLGVLAGPERSQLVELAAGHLVVSSQSY